eukprot:TRINITY_DN4023_c2_g1_i2.p1 TRINITY_DN4023_c2_g1~~TRINITY_DN4023_c2_g1_i2.p1  ORF type:complete len:436 (-),score=57.78 TRINITY_DN4023_c2_g1_i2:177-1484(-)
MSADSEMTTSAANKQKLIFLIYLLVVLYALCYQLQSPLEPFLIEKLVGKDKGSEVAVAYGRLQSVHNVVQSFCALGFGYLLDRAGLRVGFIVNFSACALTYYLLSTTTSITGLYLSKLPGIGMAGFLCAQYALTQLTEAGEERIKALGRVTTAYTIGGTFGPYLGGLLGSKGDYFLSAKIAMVGSLLAVVLSFFLPAGRTVGVEDSTEKASKEQVKSAWLQRAGSVLRLAGFFILVKLGTSTANSMASSSQSLILKNELGFSEANLGFFMSSQFAFGGFANGFLLAPVTKLLGGEVRTVVRNCVMIMAAGYALQAAISSSYLGLFPAGTTTTKQYSFIGIAMTLAIFQYSLATSITAETTRIVPEDMRGTLIGMEHCIFAVSRIFTPSIGVTILASYGSCTLYATIGCCFLAVLVFWSLFSSKMLKISAAEKKNG